MTGSGVHKIFINMYISISSSAGKVLLVIYYVNGMRLYVDRYPLALRTEFKYSQNK